MPLDPVLQVAAHSLSIRCILGDIRRWVGDHSKSFCLVSLPIRFSQPTLRIIQSRDRANRGQLRRFKGRLPERHGQSLAVTVLYVPVP